MVFASASFAPTPAQPRATGHLRVVDMPRYSQIPHSVVFDNTISPGARLLYAGLQARWWRTGECSASHATLAADFGVSERQIRRYVDELVAAKHIVERRHGRGQAKAYSPCKPRQQDGSVLLDDSQQDSLTNMSALESPNRTDLSDQQDGSVQPNRTDLSTIYRPGDIQTPPEEIDPERRVAADAAPAPPAGKPPSKKTRQATGDDAVTRELFDYYRSKIQPKARVNAPEKIRARLKTFSADELRQAIDNFAGDWWWMKRNASQGVEWFFRSDRQVERFLNLVPRAEPEAPTRAADRPRPPRPDDYLPSTAHRAISERF